jgi:hypothetical protein
MKHTNRMFLIPEELYQHYFSSQSVQSQDGSPLGHIQSKMQILSDPLQANSRMGKEERAIRYDQEYKRYSKLQKDQEEKPLNVRLQNLREIVENIPAPVVQENKTTIPISKKASKKVYLQKMTKKFSKPIKKGKSTIDDNENDDDDDEEEEEEIFEDAKTGKDDLIAGTSEANIFVERKKKAYDYVSRNLKDLGINSHGQIVQTSNIGAPIPIKTSSVATIIDHLVNNQGNRRQPLPTGYDKFVERIVRHPELVKILGLKQKRHQSGSGMVLFKKAYKREKIPFKFKPSLWK